MKVIRKEERNRKGIGNRGKEKGIEERNKEQRKGIRNRGKE